MSNKKLSMYYYYSKFRDHSTLKNSSFKMTEFIRLPKSVTPVNYTLELQPNLSDFTFAGKVTIDVNVS